MTTRRAPLALVALLLASASCGTTANQDTHPKPDSADGGRAVPSYHGDIEPIVRARCEMCHIDGGIAPFPLTTYDQVRGKSAAIARAVSERIMPPWLAGKGCADYKGDRSLTDLEISTITRWAQEGTEEGDPQAGRIDGPPRSVLSRVDATLTMSEPYTPVSTAPDDYRCFVLDLPLATTKFVTGFRVRPGNPKIAHHAIAYLAMPADLPTYQKLDAADPGPGYACGSGPGGGIGVWLAAWGPGSDGAEYPVGTGIKVPMGSKVVLQLHYNTSTSPPTPDTSRIELQLADKVKKEATLLRFADPSWFNNGTMKIAAHATDATHSFAADPSPYMDVITGGVIHSNKPFTVYSGTMHMHQRGTKGTLGIVRASGEQQCVLDVPRWNYHWQGAYELAKPTRFNPGDKLAIECHWANPTDTARNWGEGTDDEMCLGLSYVTE